MSQSPLQSLSMLFWPWYGLFITSCSGLDPESSPSPTWVHLHPAPFLRLTHLPRLLLEAKPPQQDAEWESFGSLQLILRKISPAPVGHCWCVPVWSHSDCEVTTRCPFLPCPLLCSSTEWKLCPAYTLDQIFFLKFTLLSVCKNESGTHSRESITCTPEIRGNDCVGLLL